MFKKLFSLIIILCVAFPSNNFASITNWGGAYTLDSSSGTTTPDSSSNANTLTEVGTVLEGTSGECQRSTCSKIDSGDGWSTVTDDNDFDWSTDLSGGCYVYPATVASNHTILAKDSGAAGWRFAMQGGGAALNLELHLQGSGTANGTVQNVPANSWTYVAFTYTDAATTEVDFYKGTGSSPNQSVNLDITPAGNAFEFTLGAGDLIAGLNGRIDECWLAREAVSGADHSSIATNGLAAFFQTRRRVLITFIAFAIAPHFQKLFDDFGHNFVYYKLVNEHRRKFSIYRPTWMKLVYGE